MHLFEIIQFINLKTFTFPFFIVIITTMKDAHISDRGWR
jgi:hypothetical protein